MKPLSRAPARQHFQKNMTNITQTAEYLAANTIKTPQQIAEQHLGPINWLNDQTGYCACPGYNSHTTGEGQRDCIIYLNDVPTLHCLHSSCREIIVRKNHELRQSIGRQPNHPQLASKSELQKLQKLRETRERYRARATQSLPRILKDWEWTYESIVAASPTAIPSCPHAQARMLLERFPADSVVWTGDRHDSGSPEHSAHFRKAGEWITEDKIAGPLICPSTFKPDCYARTNENVMARPFLVVESDTLNKDQAGGIYHWLHKEVDMDLVAIVDTAGKSLHAWFSSPDDCHLEDLKIVLGALQCDPKMFVPSQPVRLPGCSRDGKIQKLIYLGKEAV